MDDKKKSQDQKKPMTGSTANKTPDQKKKDADKKNVDQKKKH